MNTTLPPAPSAEDTLFDDVTCAMSSPRNAAFLALCDDQTARGYPLTLLDLLHMAQTRADFQGLESVCERLLSFGDSIEATTGEALAEHMQVVILLHLIRSTRRVLALKGDA